METPVVEVRQTAKVPNIVVTEPSPLVPNNCVVVAPEKAVPVHEVTSAVATTQPVQSVETQDEPISVQVALTTTDSEANSSEGFTLAEECETCVVPVPELESQSVDEAATAMSLTDNDDFRTDSAGGCCLGILACMLGYERFWERIDRRCRIAFWLLLMAVPISAGVMGAFNMYSCPAATMLPSAVFSIGISLVALLTIRVCAICHRMSSEQQDTGRVLHTLLLISMFLTALFFATESVLFWQMESTSEPETEMFCDPTFVSFAFWWNCVMWVVIIPLIFFPS